MTRHSKNNTASSIFTYWERQKIKDEGTKKFRLGASSQRRFEQCWLCFRTAIDPLCTKRGHLFCRSCIMNNFLEQKLKYEKKLRIQSDSRTCFKSEEYNSNEHQLEDSAQNQYLSAIYPAHNLKADVNQNDKQGCFWMPRIVDLKKDIKDTKKLIQNEKGKLQLLCPVISKPIRIKDLITLIPEYEYPGDKEHSR
ncbi:hypothetical protein ACR3K2_21820 [Cryptosporidium serpentis]